MGGELNFIEMLNQTLDNPMLLIAVLLTLGVIFVNGCFWHGHKGCKYFVWPKNNAEFWKKKIEDNISRDQKKTEALEEQGWKVIVVWECELKKDAELALSKIVKEMRKQ